MTSNVVKTFLKYVVILGVTILLTWLSLRGLKTEGENPSEYILKTWNQSSKPWLIAMAVLAMTSHVIRAVRWKMLLISTGHHVTTLNSFLSLMVGYLVNLAIPRGGEISRCYNLYKLNRTPVDVSFGTVVVERVVDLLCLLLLLVVTFLIEAKKLTAFFGDLSLNSESTHDYSGILLIAGAGLLLAIMTFLVLLRSHKLRAWVLSIWLGVKKGLLSVLHLRQRTLFVFYSLAIWVLYYLMSYSVIMAFDATAHLGFGAVTSLFAIGSIAMAIPLPGGTGSYHVLVPQGLVLLYSVPRPEAVAFTFIFHGWQTLLMIVGGVLALLATLFLSRSPKGD